jgi:hypothetical protein
MAAAAAGTLTSTTTVEPSKRDRIYLTTMVVLADVHAAATIKFPQLMTVDALIRAVNDFDWPQMQVHYRPIVQKHLRFYAMFYLSPTLGWTELDPAQPLAMFNLPNLAILALKRKKVIELEYQCAIGPHASQFVPKVKLADRSSASVEGDVDPVKPVKARSSKRKIDKRREPKLKTVLSLSLSIPEAVDALSHWVVQTFDSTLTPAAAYVVPRGGSGAAVTSSNNVLRESPPGVGSSVAQKDGSDDDDSDSISKATTTTPPVAPTPKTSQDEESVGGDTDEEDMETKKPSKPSMPLIAAAAVPTATAPSATPTKAEPAVKPDELALRRNGMPLKARVLEEASIVAGDFVELRHGDNAV